MNHTTRLFKRIKAYPDWHLMLMFKDWTPKKHTKWISDVQMVTLMLKACGFVPSNLDHTKVNYDELTWSLYLESEILNGLKNKNLS